MDGVFNIYGVYVNKEFTHKQLKIQTEEMTWNSSNSRV